MNNNKLKKLKTLKKVNNIRLEQSKRELGSCLLKLSKIGLKVEKEQKELTDLEQSFSPNYRSNAFQYELYFNVLEHKVQQLQETKSKQELHKQNLSLAKDKVVLANAKFELVNISLDKNIQVQKVQALKGD